MKNKKIQQLKLLRKIQNTAIDIMTGLLKEEIHLEESIIDKRMGIVKDGVDAHKEKSKNNYSIVGGGLVNEGQDKPFIECVFGLKQKQPIPDYSKGGNFTSNESIAFKYPPVTTKQENHKSFVEWLKIENKTHSTFLTSCLQGNSIVRLESIITVDNNEDSKKYLSCKGNTILFHLKDSNPMYWEYEDKSDYLKDWNYVNSILKQRES